MSLDFGYYFGRPTPNTPKTGANADDNEHDTFQELVYSLLSFESIPHAPLNLARELTSIYNQNPEDPTLAYLPRDGGVGFRYIYSTDEKFIIGKNSSALVYVGIKEEDKLPIALKVPLRYHQTTDFQVNEDEVANLIKLKDVTGSIHYVGKRAFARATKKEGTRVAYAIATDLCDGSLKNLVKWWNSLLAHDGPLNYYRAELYLTRVCAIKCLFIQIVNAFQSLHAISKHHRDLNPKNILVNSQRQVKICDYGWGKNGEAARYSDPECFRAREYLRTKQSTPKCDVMALGRVLFYLLTSRKHPSESYIFEHSDFKDFIKFSLKDKSIGFELLAAVHFIRWTDQDPNARPEMHQLLDHPFLWSQEEQLAFLLQIPTVCHQVQLEELDRAITSHLPEEYGIQFSGWKSVLPPYCKEPSYPSLNLQGYDDSIVGLLIYHKNLLLSNVLPKKDRLDIMKLFPWLLISVWDKTRHTDGLFIRPNCCTTPTPQRSFIVRPLNLDSISARVASIISGQPHQSIPPHPLDSAILYGFPGPLHQEAKGTLTGIGAPLMGSPSPNQRLGSSALFTPGASPWMTPPQTRQGQSSNHNHSLTSSSSGISVSSVSTPSQAVTSTPSPAQLQPISQTTTPTSSNQSTPRSALASSATTTPISYVAATAMPPPVIINTPATVQPSRLPSQQPSTTGTLKSSKGSSKPAQSAPQTQQSQSQSQSTPTAAQPIPIPQSQPQAIPQSSPSLSSSNPTMVPLAASVSPTNTSDVRKNNTRIKLEKGNTDGNIFVYIGESNLVFTLTDMYDIAERLLKGRLGKIDKKNKEKPDYFFVDNVPSETRKKILQAQERRYFFCETLHDFKERLREAAL